MQKGRLEQLVVRILLQDLSVAIDAPSDLSLHIFQHCVRLLQQLLVGMGQLTRVLLLVPQLGLQVVHLEEQADFDHQLLCRDVDSSGLPPKDPADGPHLFDRVEVETALFAVVEVKETVDFSLVAEHGAEGEILDLFDSLNVVGAAHELWELVKLKVVDEHHLLPLHDQVLNAGASWRVHQLVLHQNKVP